MGSLYLTCCLSLERFLAIIHPFWKHRLSLHFRHYALPASLFVVVFKVPR
jgi:hypothetical protein